jgi:S4 domain protein YaaA
MEEYVLKKEFITLGQFLKEMNIINSGGMAKAFLAEEEVLVNGELENRRGKKLYDQTTVETLGETYLVRNPTDEELAEMLEEEAEKKRVEAIVREMNQQNKKKKRPKKPVNKPRRKPVNKSANKPSDKPKGKQPPKFPGSK